MTVGQEQSLSPVLFARYQERHVDNPVVLRKKEDADNLIEVLRRMHFTNSVCILRRDNDPDAGGGSVGHSNLVLGVAVRPRDERGAIWFRSNKRYWVGQGEFSRQTDYYYMHQRIIFPSESDVSLDTIRKAIVQFLSNGGYRPLGRDRWKEWGGTIPEVIQQN